MEKDYVKNIPSAERRMFEQTVELRADGDAQYFEGVGIVFNTVTDLGYFSEEIKSGALDDVMDNDVRGLFNHDSNVVLGRSKSGTMKLSVNSKDARYKIKYNPNDPDHVRVMEKISRGDVSGSSFAFTVKDASWETRNGKDHRIIEKLETWFDVGPVTYPAYTDTTVAKRSLDSIKAESEERQKKENESAAKRRQIQVECDLIRLGIFN